MSPTMSPLTEVEISTHLASVPTWQVQKGELVKTFTFSDFKGSLAFVNKVGELAEKAGHHPDISVNYNLVTLALSTHSEGGVTEKDFQLAKEIDALTD